MSETKNDTMMLPLTELEMRILIDLLRDKPTGVVVNPGEGLYHYTHADRLAIDDKLMVLEVPAKKDEEPEDFPEAPVNTTRKPTKLNKAGARKIAAMAYAYGNLTKLEGYEAGTGRSIPAHANATENAARKYYDLLEFLNSITEEEG